MTCAIYSTALSLPCEMHPQACPERCTGWPQEHCQALSDDSVPCRSTLTALRGRWRLMSPASRTRCWRPCRACSRPTWPPRCDTLRGSAEGSLPLWIQGLNFCCSWRKDAGVAMCWRLLDRVCSWRIWLISHLPEALQLLKEGNLGAELPPSCNTKQCMARAADVQCRRKCSS